MMRSRDLHPVCEEAACPNIGECWKSRHATFMILGDTCTRACAFCNVRTGKPNGRVDEDEPENLAKSVAEMALAHVVITSVDRDDLADGGASQFVRAIAAVRRLSPATTIEVLTPDFRNKSNAEEAIFKAKPDVFNHNLETVPRVYKTVRPGADYRHSLGLLARAKTWGLFTKSGIMVGLGETVEEIAVVMDDLRSANVDFLTIGQYLQPTLKHAAVARFVTPEQFKAFEVMAYAKGFKMVAATPLTRSSYHADRDFAQLRAGAENAASR